MNKILGLIPTLVLMITTLSSNGFAEDIPNSTALPLAKVVNNIYSQGYNGINKIEYDDGVYKAIVINKDGQEQYLYIDPATAAVPVPKQSTKEINMSQAIAAIPQDRCKVITSVEYYNGAYKVECLDSNNYQVEVLVDAVSAKISQISYDD
ncbi:PepSY domain-containing protein [Francisella hispaniensis]|uniref:PepSY domain-containing protein n=1 Tax=Francisella hispaniensis TaxID=622488 RepID=UPI0019068644|nr:PepSY domain-containing protein [Francisella hispaniensis]MBK2357043.1 PepSY domain-containing protein [Francisella hispaniensis]